MYFFPKGALLYGAAETATYVRPAEQTTLAPECQGGFASLRSEQGTASLAPAAIPARMKGSMV